ncbi:MAG: TetR/AcrR family transcriptional regulator [Pseudomonadota bacterium]
MNSRQSQIANAAIPMFLADGVSVSTASIAKAAGVANGTLFNAFATKQALIDAIYVMAKANMFIALAYQPGAPFDRQVLKQCWSGYLAWARRAPEEWRIMHLLHDAGLASDDAQAKVNAMFAPHGTWIGEALEAGKIQGPSLAFLQQLILRHLDLVVTQDLNQHDETVAFDMLCNTIGLTA